MRVAGLRKRLQGMEKMCCHTRSRSCERLVAIHQSKIILRKRLLHLRIVAWSCDFACHMLVWLSWKVNALANGCIPRDKIPTPGSYIWLVPGSWYTDKIVDREMYQHQICIESSLSVNTLSCCAQGKPSCKMRYHSYTRANTAPISCFPNPSLALLLIWGTWHAKHFLCSVRVITIYGRDCERVVLKCRAMFQRGGNIEYVWTRGSSVLSNVTKTLCCECWDIYMIPSRSPHLLVCEYSKSMSQLAARSC